MKFNVTIVSIVGFSLSLSCEQGSAQTPSGKSLPRVLLLYSKDRLLPANLRLDTGFREALGDHCELFTEFLDAVRLPGEERNDAMAASLRVRYKERPPNVLIAAGRNAATNYIKASPKWRALFGLPTTGRITMDEVMKCLHAEDEARVRN